MMHCLKRPGFGFVMNYVLEYEEYRPDADGGVRLNAEAGDFEQPEVRWTASMDWAQDDFAASLAVNYVGEFSGDADSGFGDKTVDAWTTVDATVTYMGLESTTLTLGATNLFNEEPPYSHHDFYGFVNTVHSGQGRFMYLQATYSF